MPTGPSRPVDIKPIAGPMDLRSSPDEVPVGGWRMLQNMGVTQLNKLCRLPGWERLLPVQNYNNQDFHDQLLSLTGGSLRQPFNLLFQAISTSGYNLLFAGTTNRIGVLNNDSGNWEIISDQLGSLSSTSCGAGFFAAQIDDTVVFTNGFDVPQYHIIGTPPTGASNQAVKPIAELSKIGLESAKVVVAWQGLMILANVTMDGERIDHRLVWSDASRPLSWVPKKGVSAAGFQDLGYGETILAAAPMGPVLLIYTTIGIWQATLSGGDPVLVFQRRYADPVAGNRCLVYKKTLVSYGNEHYYMSRDGIYAYHLYTDKPERVEWIHRASSIIYDNLNSSNCDAHVGGYNPTQKSIWFSWADSGSDCPTKSLIIIPEFRFSAFVNHGFSAFSVYNPDVFKTLRQWLVENCICTIGQMADLGNGFIKEGQYCNTPPAQSCPNPPINIYTSTPRVDDGFTVEDYTQATPDPDSIAGQLMAQFGNLPTPPFCTTEFEQDDCNPDFLFVGASTTDLCLKQIGTAYSRERCVGFNSCGQYTYDGYQSIMRTGPIDVRIPNNVKILKGIMLENQAEPQNPPLNVVLRVGASDTASDPNTDNCQIVWFPLGPRPLKCTGITSAQYRARNLRPITSTYWPAFIEARFLYLEFTIDGAGGASCFSRIEMDIISTVKFL